VFTLRDALQTAIQQKFAKLPPRFSDDHIQEVIQRRWETKDPLHSATFALASRLSDRSSQPAKRTLSSDAPTTSRCVASTTAYTASGRQ
jgi:hypothetical protein